MADLSITVKAQCSECARWLDLTIGHDVNNVWVAVVEPCTDCLDKADREGYERCERENGL